MRSGFIIARDRCRVRYRWVEMCIRGSALNVDCLQLGRWGVRYHLPRSPRILPEATSPGVGRHEASRGIDEGTEAQETTREGKADGGRGCPLSRRREEKEELDKPIEL